MSTFIGIVGSRRRCSLADQLTVRNIIKKAKEQDADVTIISGGCNVGADAFAKHYAAKVFNVKYVEYPIDRRGIPEGKAGKIEFTKRAYTRNTLIAEASLDALFALVHDDRTGGTENTVGTYQDLIIGGDGRRHLFIVDGQQRINIWKPEIVIRSTFVFSE